MQAAVNAEKRRQLCLRTIATIAVLGAAVSAYSLYHHFSRDQTSFCNLSETLNCDLVNRSAYSTLLGIPVALIGIVGYLFILALATAYRRNSETPLLLLIASLGGLGFALYLTYIEGFVLHAWCILCLSSLALIGASAAISGVNLKLSQRSA
jgi:uncharacterized membrane protein